MHSFIPSVDICSTNYQFLVQTIDCVLFFPPAQQGEHGKPPLLGNTTATPTPPGQSLNQTNFQGRADNNSGNAGATPYHNNNFYPPVQGPPHAQQQVEGLGGMQPQAAGQWGNPEGRGRGRGYYGDGYFRGQSDRGMRARGRGFVPLRGRGRGFQTWKRGMEIDLFLLQYEVVV